MKKPLAFLFLLGLIAAPVRADIVLQPNDMLAITGDSITAQHIYSADLEDYLLMCQPTLGFDCAQFGWSGEDARALLFRLPFDVLPFKPTIVTTCYGMNDGRYTNLTDEIANTYRDNQTGIVELLKKSGVRTILLGSPKCVDPYVYTTRNGVDAAAYNRNLAALAAIDKDIAAKEGVIYADVYDAMVSAIDKAHALYPNDHMSGDGVHPGPDGHLVMAYAFLKAMGCDGNIGTLTVDYGQNQASGTPGQEVVSYQNGTLTVKSTRYPYCFEGQPDHEDGQPASMLRAIPFNEELNRYMLVVKGLTTAKARITWGNTSKEFASADLEKGINLAAEFLVNPFCTQFKAVDNYVHIEQDQEQGLTQDFMFQVPRFKAFIAPTGADALDQVVAAGMAQREKLFHAAASLVTPVQHTISIEPE